MRESLIVMLGFWGFFALVGFAVWTLSQNSRRSRVARLQSDAQAKLLEKFVSSDDLRSFLDSEAGRRFVESASIERANPYGRILASVQSGIVLALFGGAVIGLGAWSREDAGVALGTLILALGAGFLVSAGASLVLSRSWGLLDRSAEHSRS